MRLNRRQLILRTAAAALAGGSGAAPAMARQAGAPGLKAVLDGIADSLLTEYPENASALGVDKASRAALKHRLADRSPAGVAARKASAAARLKTLNAVDRTGLDGQALIDLDTVKAAHELAVQGYRFPYGDVANLNLQWAYRNTPYAVSQGTGAFAEIPDLLDSTHVIETAEDAEAYLDRMAAYARAIDGETERLKHETGLKVIAPDFLLDKTLGQMAAVRGAPPASWGLVTSISRRAREKSLTGDWQGRAAAIAEKQVGPALDRQIAVLKAQRAKATADAGAWKLPEGEAYYAWALAAGTTSKLTPDEVHELGKDQARSLASEMDGLLRKQGLSKGSVGERMAELAKDPKNLFPNTDEGRAQVLAYLNQLIADIRPKLPQAFGTLKPGKLIIKRVPVEIQHGAPNGYAGAGTIDGSQPGNYYINLKDTAHWPKYSLPTLTYHEGIPGHIWQGEYTYNLPLVRSLLSFNAYTEGWALYAEQLAAELGAYEHDPLGRLGYLQSMQFRACRLVVDTGLHAKRWTREQAAQWFAENNGDTPEHFLSEVDRYCAWPGQACGYKIGHSEINRLRLKAMAGLTKRFDIKAFDDTLVMAGAVPLTTLEKIVDRYIASVPAA